MGVQATSGGVGASVLTAMLAARAARDGQVLCVDPNPWSCGLDLLLGLEEEPGLRWADLELLAGDADAPALVAGLPAREGVRVLGGDRRPHRRGPAQPVEVATALAVEADLTLIDLPALGPASAHWWSVCDSVLALTGTAPDQVIATVSTVDLIPRLRGIVCRSEHSADARHVAAVLALPLLARVSHDAGVPAALTAGQAVRARPRSRLSGVLDELLDHVRSWRRVG